MKCNFFFYLLVLLIFHMKSNAQDIDKHQWQNRVLIIKTNSINSKEFNNQLIEIKKDKEGLIERKLVIYHIKKDTMTHLNFGNNEKYQICLKLRDDDLLTPTKKFEVLLIGLDGGIKVKQKTPIRLEELYRIIDAMPMRVRELRENRK